MTGRDKSNVVCYPAAKPRSSPSISASLTLAAKHSATTSPVNIPVQRPRLKLAIVQVGSSLGSTWRFKVSPPPLFSTSSCQPSGRTFSSGRLTAFWWGKGLLHHPCYRNTVEISRYQLLLQYIHRHILVPAWVCVNIYVPLSLLPISKQFSKHKIP